MIMRISGVVVTLVILYGWFCLAAPSPEMQTEFSDNFVGYFTCITPFPYQDCGTYYSETFAQGIGAALGTLAGLLTDVGIVGLHIWILAFFFNPNFRKSVKDWTRKQNLW